MQKNILRASSRFPLTRINRGYLKNVARASFSLNGLSPVWS